MTGNGANEHKSSQAPKHDREAEATRAMGRRLRRHVQRDSSGLDVGINQHSSGTTANGRRHRPHDRQRARGSVACYRSGLESCSSWRSLRCPVLNASNGRSTTLGRGLPIWPQWEP